MMMTQLVSLNDVSMPHHVHKGARPIQSTLPYTAPVLIADGPHPNGERKVKGPYFEFAKKKWETEDTFRYGHLL